MLAKDALNWIWRATQMDPDDGTLRQVAVAHFVLLLSNGSLDGRGEDADEARYRALRHELLAWIENNPAVIERAIAERIDCRPDELR